MFSKIIYNSLQYASSRYVTEHFRELKSLMEKDWSNRQSVNLKRLAKILTYSKFHVPYYRDLLTSINFNPEKILSSPESLREIPILTKDDILEHGSRLIAEPYQQLIKLHAARTNGSTGPNLTVYYDPVALDKSAAVTMLTQQWVGFQLGQKQVHLSTPIPDHGDQRSRKIEFWRRLGSRRESIEIGNLHANELEIAAKKLANSQASLLQGLPSQLYALASVAHEKNIHLNSRVGAVVSTGEKLHNYQRKKIENVFKCRVINRYGNAEFGIIAHGDNSTADDSDQLRVIDTNFWIENYFDTSKRIPSQIVVTGMANLAMPLINYATGDLAIVKKGESGVFITNLAGRVHDTFLAGERRFSTQYVQDILNAKTEITDFQIIVDVSDQIKQLLVVCEIRSQRMAIAELVLQLFGKDVSLKFVNLNEFRLRGRQNKFSHLVRE